MIRTDVAIVGAGPAGLFGIFQCGMLGLRTVVLDVLPEVGGQCAALYPEKPIYDIPAFDRIDAAELVSRLARQAAPFQPEYRLGERVESLVQAPNGGWHLETSGGMQVRANAVILAAGAGAFQPNRPNLANLGEFEAAGSVLYIVGRRELFRGKRVVIAGGGDSAVDWAVSLAEVAERVSVVHRRDRFRAAPESERRLRSLALQGTLDLVVPCQLDSLIGTRGCLKAVRVRNAEADGEMRDLPADVLLPFFGLETSLGPIADWGVGATGGHGILVDPATCATGLPGVFAIGDVAAYPGKQRLILTAFAEAAVAAHAAHALARPGDILRFQHSTSRGRPGSGAFHPAAGSPRRAGIGR